jgi:alanyl-tRNA synthetase
MGVTERLYYHDSYLTHFTAAIQSVDGVRAYLDRTAFYPTSGGQPFDTGFLNGARVLEVTEEGESIVHVLDRPIEPGEATGGIDWARRFDHMQQHTGQHLLSAVFEAHAGLATIGFHLGRDVSTIDLTAPQVDAQTLERIERSANEEIARNREVAVSFEDAASVGELRKASDRSGTLRIVTIAGLDRSACGGTHVRRTGEIGCILLGRTEKIRNSTRIEFVCGLRAISAARADRKALKTQADALHERIGALEKERRKLSADLATLLGRDLYARTPSSADGLRRALRRVDEIDDRIRAEAQSFAACGVAIYVALTGEAVLLAVSSDCGWNAGQLIKQFAQRGGGTPALGQGNIGDPAALLTALGFPG